MTHAPAFQWYPGDWLAKTNCLRGKTKGFFLVLINILWLSEDQNSIEDDSELICSELGCDEEEWTFLRNIAIKRGLLKPNETNRLSSPDLIEIRSQQVKRAEQMRENGKKGGRPKNQSKPKAKQTETKSKANESSSSSSSSPSSSSTSCVSPPEGGEGSASPKPVPPAKREKKQKTVKAQVPPDWEPSESFWEWLKKRKPDISRAEAEAQIEKFKDASAAKDYKYSDFNAALRNWFTSDYFSLILKDDRPQPERPPANETPEERDLRARRERSRANFDALMKYGHIDNGMGKVIPTCEVSYNRENDPDYLIWKGERYSVGSFEGVRSNVYAIR